jgi:hypothetical protein
MRALGSGGGLVALNYLFLDYFINWNFDQKRSMIKG